MLEHGTLLSLLEKIGHISIFDKSLAPTFVAELPKIITKLMSEFDIGKVLPQEGSPNPELVIPTYVWIGIACGVIGGLYGYRLGKKAFDKMVDMLEQHCENKDH